jgi:type I restriction enzyme M protein
MTVVAKANKQKKQALGIYYTPRVVVEFIVDILNFRKAQEPERWSGKQPSVIDPACGEGIFLKVALEKSLTKAEWIFGMDIDGAAVETWKSVNLLQAFDGDTQKLAAHFFHQNGLDKLHWEQHKSAYYRKLKKTDVEAQQFDFVVGNPPYGGSGLDTAHLSDSLALALDGFELLPPDIKNDLSALATDDLFGNTTSKKSASRLKSFPIEALFVERALQLAKPNGWIALVLPEGVFSNSKMNEVRMLIARCAKVDAIISLARETFKNAGANAKTSIIIMQKYPAPLTLDGDMSALDYRVFLASTTKYSDMLPELENWLKPQLDALYLEYKEWITHKRLLAIPSIHIPVKKP